MEEKKNIEVVSGDGSNLEISPVYDHLNVSTPKSAEKKPKYVVIPEEKKKFPIGGYAPGNYSCICTTCKTTFIGDKRAVQCEKCATELVKEVTEATAVEKAAMEHLAFWRLRNNIHLSNPIHAERCKNDYKSGVAWQKTRSYTYAEMKESFSKGHDSARLKGSYKSNESFEEDWEIWSNQFKKK